MIFSGYPGRRQGQWRETEHGFTLLELMIVVGILAIATAIALPNFTRWYNQAQLKQATSELSGNLNLAKMAARNLNVTVTVTLAVVSGRVTASFTPSNVAPIQTMPAEVTAFSGGPIQFTSLGTRAGGGTATQSITLTNKSGMTYEIQVAPSGKVRWCVTSPCT